VLVYRDAGREAVTAEVFGALDRRLRAPMDADAALTILIDAGMLEAALVDAAQPHEDEPSCAQAALRAFSEAAGRLVLEPTTERARQALARLEQARGFAHAKTVTMKTPEGYAWYALHPAAYAAAARRFADQNPEGPVTVVGLRSVGTSLAAVAAAALERAGRVVFSMTLRPRGHPFDRRPVLGPELERRLLRQAENGASFLVVDEGPGLSGSSLTGTAQALAALGVSDGRISLMPANDVDGSNFVSESARAAWPRFRRFPAATDLTFPPSLTGTEDLSGGLWRRRLGLRGVPVAPQHERIKRLDEPAGTLWRFGGLGCFGEATRERASAAAQAGFSPTVLDLKDGFLALSFIEGRPLRVRDRPQVIERAVAYLRWVGAERGIGATADLEPLKVMIRRNTELAFGTDGRLAALERVALSPVEAVHVDGRLSPQEWVATADRVLKTDGFDHGDDHFLPGPTDPTWDAAGFAIEWGLDDPAAHAFATAVGGEGMAARLPFHLVAYAAFRLGMTTMSADGVTGADRAGLRAQAARYRAVLDRALDRLNAS
jgi:hypothetical protein